MKATINLAAGCIATAIAVIGVPRIAHAQCTAYSPTESMEQYTGSGGYLTSAVRGMTGGAYNSVGVFGQASSNCSVGASQYLSAGVYGEGDESNSYGVYGYSASWYGLYGTTDANEWAMYGYAPYGDGLYAEGDASGGYGVVGNATGSYGYGVYGECSGTGCFGIYGKCSGAGCYSGYFTGDVDVVSGHSYLYAGSCVAGACASDARLKKNIEPLSGTIDKLLQVKGVTYEWKIPDDRHPSGRHMGVIAQDVEKVFPEWVTQTSDGWKAVNIDQRAMLGVTVEGFRTLKTENDALKAETTMLKDRVAALESGRQPVAAGFNLNGVGFGLGGLAIAGAVLISRRKREQRPSQL